MLTDHRRGIRADNNYQPVVRGIEGSVPALVSIPVAAKAPLSDDLINRLAELTGKGRRRRQFVLGLHRDEPAVRCFGKNIVDRRLRLHANADDLGRAQTQTLVNRRFCQHPRADDRAGAC
ncbi:MAG: hypothetical protein ACREFJ_08915 [Acetobacteraceae bacterium]